MNHPIPLLVQQFWILTIKLLLHDETRPSYTNLYLGLLRLELSVSKPPLNNLTIQPCMMQRWADYLDSIK